jgi:hypothetical protein
VSGFEICKTSYGYVFRVNCNGIISSDGKWIDMLWAKTAELYPYLRDKSAVLLRKNNHCKRAVLTIFVSGFIL